MFSFNSLKQLSHKLLENLKDVLVLITKPTQVAEVLKVSLVDFFALAFSDISEL